MRVANLLMKASLCMLLPAMWLLSSCSEDYMVYDASYSGIYFSDDTLKYSFGVTSVDIREKEYRIPVYLMGAVSSTDRTFSCMVENSSTAVEGVHYTIGTPVITADSVNGYIPVKIFRDALEGNYIDGFVRYKLPIRLVAQGDFRPTLSTKEQVCVLVFDNATEQPDWLDYKGDKNWYVSEYGVWHPLKFIKMVEYFHKIKDILPETYASMVKVYGENLEHVEYASFYQYQTIMNKYVFYPMYEYFAAPENRNEILAMYPDFPFDFPNPYD